jgi:uroporphyrin-III C-methyltransferase
MTKATAAGRVTLIGCGPGDPELLTLRAVKRLEAADVIVVDRLVSPAIVALAKPGARRIDAGKEPDAPSADQSDINRVLVREALKGNHVVRLKGGDCFVFGRAAEEMAAVRASGIEVEVVPGITAAHACAASVGLPLTLRRSIRQFSILTGSSADEDFELDWSALARPGQAFAIYMGVRTASRLRAKLLAAGAEPSITVVIVENGTRPEERAVVATLDQLPAAISAKGIRGPAIIFVGLDWSRANLSMPGKVEIYDTNGTAAERRISDRQGPAPARNRAGRQERTSRRSV